MQTKNRYYDYNLIAAAVLLTCFGLVMLYSTSAYTSSVRHGSDMYLFGRQAVFSVVAVAAAILFSYIPYSVYRYLSIPVYAGALILMALVRTPLGMTVNGARRWLSLGPLSFQPSETAKLAVILFVPMLIERMGRNFRGVRNALIPLAAGGIQAAAAYFLTDNLSTALIILGITVVITFVAYPGVKPFLALGGVCAASAAGVVAYCMTHNASTSFRMRRIMIWLHPEKYAEEGGYQVLQALYALGSGGLFGKGLGNGTQKLWAVPEAENDMIFSIICEELGIFGGFIVILLFIYLLYRLFVIAENAPGLYGGLVVAGIFAHVSLQVILNICVVINLVPTTGVTLPFMSYGGTSMLMLMGEISIALSVSRSIRFRRKDEDLWGDVVSHGRKIKRRERHA